jgi:hypothetical protein
MKNAILTLVCLFAVSQLASANFGQSDMVVSGKLLDDINLKGRINKMIFTENKMEIRLVNEYVESESCENGQFKVEKVANGLFELTGVIKCDQWVDEPQEVSGCPENFMPVCGEVLGSEFGKALPEVRTFSNSCELYRAKAIFIKSGSCNQ